MDAALSRSKTYSRNSTITPNPTIPQITVTNETTGMAILRLADEQNLCALNFASAKSPGGGYLNGAIAQEEDLALASGLGASLSTPPSQKFYQEHAQYPSCLHLDLAIYSPRVPFFRDPLWRMLPAPVPCDIITCAAPNTNKLKESEPKSLPHVKGAFERRIELILKLAQHHHVHTLILGAWGCGVFGNNPQQVATLFCAGILKHGGTPHIHFAVYDTSQDQKTFNAFKTLFT
jgi:uncharacterized protein (TIGR02452 family)